MANVATYGTYDLFHVGHLSLMRPFTLSRLSVRYGVKMTLNVVQNVNCRYSAAYATRRERFFETLSSRSRKSKSNGGMFKDFYFF